MEHGGPGVLEQHPAQLAHRHLQRGHAQLRGTVTHNCERLRLYFFLIIQNGKIHNESNMRIKRVNCAVQYFVFCRDECRADDYHIADGGRLGVRGDRIQTGAGIEGRHRQRAHQGHGGGGRGLLPATPAHLRHLLVKIYGQPHGHLQQVSAWTKVIPSSVNTCIIIARYR